MKKRFLSGMMGAVLLLTGLMTAMTASPLTVRADSEEKSWLCLGADLRAAEKASVLDLLGVKEEDLDDYEVVTVTNKDEHDYLDNYLSSDIIGSRALSSVLVEKKDKGSGIHVTTRNITYCTESMYANALTTAGISDAEVKVAGPFRITGTAALVGAMKAYEDMTGVEIRETAKDTATNELVLTSELAEQVGYSSQAEELISMLKQYVAEHGTPSDKEMEDAIKDGEQELGLTLTPEQEEQILSLMKKIDDLDLDVDELKKQAGEIYEKIASIEIDQKGFFEKIKSWIDRIFALFDK